MEEMQLWVLRICPTHNSLRKLLDLGSVMTLEPCSDKMTEVAKIPTNFFHKA